MGFKFFHTPSPRRFNYTPRVYDPLKERQQLQEKDNDAERDEYAGYRERIPGSMKRGIINNERGTGYNNITRMVIIVVIFVLLFTILYLIVKYFDLLWRLM